MDHRRFHSAPQDQYDDQVEDRKLAQLAPPDDAEPNDEEEVDGSGRAGYLEEFEGGVHGDDLEPHS